MLASSGSHRLPAPVAHRRQSETGSRLTIRSRSSLASVLLAGGFAEPRLAYCAPFPPSPSSNPALLNISSQNRESETAPSKSPEQKTVAKSRTKNPHPPPPQDTSAPRG